MLRTQESFFTLVSSAGPLEEAIKMRSNRRFLSLVGCSIVFMALLIPNSSLAAAWEEKSVSLPTGGTEGVLWGISCFSSTFCAAGGDFFNGSIWGAAGDEWNGSSWSVASVEANPGDKNGDLRSVYCYSATRCWGVGAYGLSGNGHTLVENRSKEGVWTRVTSPDPSGKSGNSAPELLGISCKTEEEEQICIATGHHLNTAGNGGIIAEEWTGASWKVLSPPENPGGQKNGILWSVSCTSHTACRAVGGWGTEAGVGVAGEEFWNGKEWKAATTPEPAGATFGALTGISCASTTSCMAVGDYKNSLGKATVLADYWNGTSWSLKEAREPTGAEASELLGVSCISSEYCVAVGIFTNGSGVRRTLAENWNGKEWSLETTPNPSGSTASGYQGVSCTAVEVCNAAGWYVSSLGTEKPVAGHL